MKRKQFSKDIKSHIGDFILVQETIIQQSLLSSCKSMGATHNLMHSLKTQYWNQLKL